MAVTEFPPGYRFQTDEAWARTKSRFPLGALVAGTVIGPFTGRKAFGAWLNLADDTLGLLRTPGLPDAERGHAAGRDPSPGVGPTLSGRVVGHRLHCWVELSTEDAVAPDRR